VTSLEQPSRRRPPKRSSGSALVRAVVLVALVALVFLLGVAFSRALDERPRTGDPVTTVQTLEPRPQEAPVRTVTETVTQP
jgi:hypothetical protein